MSLPRLKILACHVSGFVNLLPLLLVISLLPSTMLTFACLAHLGKSLLVSLVASWTLLAVPAFSARAAPLAIVLVLANVILFLLELMSMVSSGRSVQSLILRVSVPSSRVFSPIILPSVQLIVLAVMFWAARKVHCIVYGIGRCQAMARSLYGLVLGFFTYVFSAVSNLADRLRYQVQIEHLWAISGSKNGCFT